MNGEIAYQIQLGGISLEIIEYFTTEKKEHWLNEIKRCDWSAGQYLYYLLSEKNLNKWLVKQH